MAGSWEDHLEQIGTRYAADVENRERLIGAIAVLRRELGEDWSAQKNHPLLWRLQGIYGNPIDGIVSMLADNITSLKAVADIHGIMSRIKNAGQYDGAAAELEVGGMLARNGYLRIVEPKLEAKRPDFFCKKNGYEFLVEVKTMRTAKETARANKTSWRIIAACSHIFPTGIILRPLSEPHLEEVERKLREAARQVTRRTSQEVDIRGVLKLYLVHPDDPDQIRKDNEWCCEQERLGLVQNCGGLQGPPDGVLEHHRVRARISRLATERQIPDDVMGVLVIVGSFLLDRGNVEKFVNGIIEEVYALRHVSAVVITTAKTMVLTPDLAEPVETEDYICIDHYPAKLVRETVLIIKNRFCRFPFDYNILMAMYTGTGNMIRKRHDP